jgi:hypothetical protein
LATDTITQSTEVFDGIHALHVCVAEI